MSMGQNKKVVRAVAVAVALGTISAGAQADSYLMSLMSLMPEYNGAARATGLAFYGTVDEGINYIKAGSTSRIQMQSGGEYSSKVGIYGQEDLGGGLKLEFNLEAGILADTGALQDSSSMFNRASWIGLKSRELGTLRLGNQLSASLPLFVDVFGVVATNSVSAWAGAAAVQTAKGVGYNSDLGPGATTLLTRVPRSLMYQTPRYAGLSAQLMYATAASATTSPRASNQGAVLSYETGPFYLGASYNQVWSAPVVLTTGATAVTVRNDIPSIGAVYDVGSLVLSTSFMMVAPKLAQDGIARVATFGTIVPRGHHTFRASAVYRVASGVHNSAGQEVDSSALGMLLGYDYALSKRTSLYARAGTVRNYGASTVVFNSAALPLQAGTANPQTGIETRSLTLGMFHHF
jgi:predicted porin